MALNVDKKHPFPEIGTIIEHTEKLFQVKSPMKNRVKLDFGKKFFIRHVICFVICNCEDTCTMFHNVLTSKARTFKFMRRGPGEGC
jgi:hypothetical protein